MILLQEDKKVPGYVEIIERNTISKKNTSVGIPKEYFFDYLLQPEVPKSILRFR